MSEYSEEILENLERELKEIDLCDLTNEEMMILDSCKNKVFDTLSLEDEFIDFSKEELIFIRRYITWFK